jgi:hypothetical protein
VSTETTNVVEAMSAAATAAENDEMRVLRMFMMDPPEYGGKGSPLD